MRILGGLGKSDSLHSSCGDHSMQHEGCPHLGACHGFADGSFYDSFFSGGNRLQRCLRQAQIKQGALMSVENIVILGVSVLLMIYLIYALLRPEKF
jgi:K+-transporting ATPase KdpF subunit